MSILPTYTGELVRVRLDGSRNQIYRLARLKKKISQRTLVAELGQTAGNWYNRLSELVLSGMLKVLPDVDIDPKTGATRQMYGATDRIKPLLLCQSTTTTLDVMRKDLKKAFRSSMSIDVLKPYLVPRVIGSVDGTELRKRYEQGLEPDLPSIGGWQIIWKY